MALNESTLILFGGITDQYPNNKSMYFRDIENFSPMAEVYNGLFITFPDSERPENAFINKVQLFR